MEATSETSGSGTSVYGVTDDGEMLSSAEAAVLALRTSAGGSGRPSRKLERRGNTGRR